MERESVPFLRRTHRMRVRVLLKKGNPSLNLLLTPSLFRKALQPSKLHNYTSMLTRSLAHFIPCRHISSLRRCVSSLGVCCPPRYPSFCLSLLPHVSSGLPEIEFNIFPIPRRRFKKQNKLRSFFLRPNRKVCSSRDK